MQPALQTAYGVMGFDGPAITSIAAAGVYVDIDAAGGLTLLGMQNNVALSGDDLQVSVELGEEGMSRVLVQASLSVRRGSGAGNQLAEVQLLKNGAPTGLTQIVEIGDQYTALVFQAWASFTTNSDAFRLQIRNVSNTDDIEVLTMRFGAEAFCQTG